MKIAIFAFILSAFAFVACSNSSNNPSDLAVEYVKAAAKGDAEKVLDMLMIDEEPSQEEVDKFSALIESYGEEIEAKGGLKKVNVLDEEISDDRAKIQIEMIFGDGSTETENFKLEKVDGKWKIIFG